MVRCLLVGNYRPSLTLMRALKRSGHSVWLGADGYSDYSEWSACADGSIVLPSLDKEHFFIAELERALVELQVDVLIPVSDRATRLVAAHRGALEGKARIASPQPDLVERCVSKTAMAELCRETRVDIAPFEHVESLENLQAAAQRIGFPVVIKPVGEGEFINGKKVVLARSARELSDNLSSWPANHTALLVQQRLDGNRLNHYFVAHEGRLVTACEIEILRTDRPDGSGYAVEGITRHVDPELAEQTGRLVQALGYTGAGCAQYMTDRNQQRTSFLEINPRLGANFGGAEGAGAGMSEAMLKLALGERPETVASAWDRAAVGHRYAWSKGDLSGLAWLARNGGDARALLTGAARLLRCALTADTHLTFDVRDPRPALGCWLHPLIKRWTEKRAHDTPSKALT